MTRPSLLNILFDFHMACCVFSLYTHDYPVALSDYEDVAVFLVKVPVLRFERALQQP